jgi:hypothetical protein
MKSTISLAILALSFMLGAAHSTLAQDLNIDDFTTGKTPILKYMGGSSNSTTQTGGANHLIGGTRTVTVNIANNPLNQLSTFQFRPDVKNGLSAFIQNPGFYVSHRVDMVYGNGAPMNADLSSFYQNGFIRLNFLGLTENLNFNIQLFTGSVWAQGGCNINYYPGQFSVELPLAKFVDKGINWADVNAMDFIFQSTSGIGIVSSAITSIEVSNTSKQGAISCHY